MESTACLTRCRQVVQKTQPNGGMKMANERPIRKFKAGGIQIAVWENQVSGRDGNEETVHNVTIERRYRDKQGNWKSTSSLRMADVPKAIIALNKAYETMSLEVVDALGAGDD